MSPKTKLSRGNIVGNVLNSCVVYLCIVKQSLMDDVSNAAQHQLLHLQKPFLHHTLKRTLSMFENLLSTKDVVNNKACKCVWRDVP